LEQDHERLHLALAQEQALDPVEDALAALGGIKAFPGLVLDRDVKQPQDRRDAGLEVPVEGQELARHLFADLAGIVRALDRKVRPEELEDGQVIRRLAVGDGAGLEDEPALGAIGMSELPIETGLADTRFPYDGHHLPVTGPGALERLVELLQLALPAH